MHHFDGAAGKTEGHRPEGALACPIGYLIERCPGRGVSIPSPIRSATTTISAAHPAPRVVPQKKQLGRTYNAYCMTPFFPSWLGNGTSRLGLPVTLSGGPPAFPRTSCAWTALADFADDEEIAATDRYGVMAELGLAMGGRLDVSFRGNNGACGRVGRHTSKHQPRSCSRARQHLCGWGVGRKERKGVGAERLAVDVKFSTIDVQSLAYFLVEQDGHVTLGTAPHVANQIDLISYV